MKKFIDECLHQFIFDSKDEFVDPMKFSTKGEDPFADYRKFHEENGGNKRFIVRYDNDGNRISK